MHFVESEEGELWMMVKDRVVLYIDKEGCMFVPKDVVAFAQIPMPPKNAKVDIAF